MALTIGKRRVAIALLGLLICLPVQAAERAQGNRTQGQIPVASAAGKGLFSGQPPLIIAEALREGYFQTRQTSTPWVLMGENDNLDVMKNALFAEVTRFYPSATFVGAKNEFYRVSVSEVSSFFQKTISTTESATSSGGSTFLFWKKNRFNTQQVSQLHQVTDTFKQTDYVILIRYTLDYYAETAQDLQMIQARIVLKLREKWLRYYENLWDIAEGQVVSRDGDGGNRWFVLANRLHPIGESSTYEVDISNVAKNMNVLKRTIEENDEYVSQGIDTTLNTLKLKAKFKDLCEKLQAEGKLLARYACEVN